MLVASYDVAFRYSLYFLGCKHRKLYRAGQLVWERHHRHRNQLERAYGEISPFVGD
jgi:hypothetical protein